MPLGTEVGLGHGDIVLDGDPAPPQKGGTVPTPNFRLMSIVAKRPHVSGLGSGVDRVELFRLTLIFFDDVSTAS